MICFVWFDFDLDSDFNLFDSIRFNPIRFDSILFYLIWSVFKISRYVHDSESLKFTLQTYSSATACLIRCFTYLYRVCVVSVLNIARTFWCDHHHICMYTHCMNANNKVSKPHTVLLFNQWEKKNNANCIDSIWMWERSKNETKYRKNILFFFNHSSCTIFNYSIALLWTAYSRLFKVRCIPIRSMNGIH